MIPRSNHKRCYGKITFEGIEYDLLFSHPQNMLTDPNISWESKGCLSHIMFLDEDIDLPLYVIAELMHWGYLVNKEELK